MPPDTMDLFGRDGPRSIRGPLSSYFKPNPRIAHGTLYQKAL